MIDVSDAAVKAFDFVAEMETVSQGEMTPEQFQDASEVAVESARHDDEKGAWIIGVGFVRPWGRVQSTVAVLAGHPEGITKRTTKYVTVDSESGEVLGYE